MLAPTHNLVAELNCRARDHRLNGDMPDAVVRRLRGVPDDRVAEEGLALCAETVQQVREIPGVAGVHVMAFGWEEAVPEILERAGMASRAPAETAGSV